MKVIRLELPPSGNTTRRLVIEIENASPSSERLLWPIRVHLQHLYDSSEFWVEGIRLEAYHRRVIRS
jgi:hypothetical protein